MRERGWGEVEGEGLEPLACSDIKLQYSQRSVQACSDCPHTHTHTHTRGDCGPSGGDAPCQVSKAVNEVTWLDICLLYDPIIAC